MFIVSVPRIFKIAPRASVVEALFTKVNGEFLRCATLLKALLQALYFSKTSS